MKKYILLVASGLLVACGNESTETASDESGVTRSNPTTSEAPKTPAERGRRAFSECAVCHTVKDGDAHRVGPNLFAIVGREAGSAEGFSYSKALTEAEFVWDETSLDSFLDSPQTFLRGNRMAYVGQRDAQKRADLIAYMKTLDTD